MKRIFAAIPLVLAASLWSPIATAAEPSGRTSDVIIEAGVSTEALVARIESLGGTVRFAYENVPAVAATVPTASLGAIARSSGVTTIEKDRLVSLTDDEGGDAHPLSFAVVDAKDVEIRPVSMGAPSAAVQPAGFFNHLYSGAAEVWNTTGFGEGSTVAVVDSGVVPNGCIGHAVTGMPGFPDGYNATGDGIPATAPTNVAHGTWVAGVIASSCALDFSEDPTDPLWLAISTYLPELEPSFVPLLGLAPRAKIYPVKVFDTTGEDTSTSMILDGLDHLLTLKKEGNDIDVVNLSFSGATIADGRGPVDKFIRELERAGMLVVTGSGNSGPVPNTVGSPATSFHSLSVGAVDAAIPSRIFYEFLGLNAFGTPGQGLVMRPTDETRIVNFSSRGPLSDGRFGPDLSALGVWNFVASPDDSLEWVAGTSFASPAVAGGAALLDAWWEGVRHRETRPQLLRNVLMCGADAEEVAPPWRSVNTQGFGVLDVPRALKRLQSRAWDCKGRQFGKRLEVNVLPEPRQGAVDAWESETVELAPGVSRDAVFEVDRFTSKVILEVLDIDVADNLAHSFFGDSLEVKVQTAKRTEGVTAYAKLLQAGADSLTLVIEDGPWTEDIGGGGPVEISSQPMEPGLMKVSLAADWVNESPVSFRIRVTREGLRTPLRDPVAAGTIREGDMVAVPIEIGPGVARATFDLDWKRKWDRFPTGDIDLVLIGPDGELASLDGATLNAPERAVIEAPAPGQWTAVVLGFELYRSDMFKLFVTLK